MTYCYRSTTQITRLARQWLHAARVPAHSPAAFGLSGPTVRLVACGDMNEQLRETVRVLTDLRSRYKAESLAVIYGQYFNPSFKGPSAEEEALRTHPEVGKAYRFASITKGREYFAGVLFVSGTFLSKRNRVRRPAPAQHALCCSHEVPRRGHRDLRVRLPRSWPA